jgi:hypothetical protein
MTSDQETQRRVLHDTIAGLRELAPETNTDMCMLSEWVLVSQWVDGDGQPWLMMLSSEHLSDSHRKGLLHIALWEWEDE